MASLTRNQREFLEHPYYASVTTVREDGSPHTTVVWVDVDDEGVLFNTATGRAKPRHLEHDPRVSLTVIDPSDGYRWISVDGRAEITTEGANESIDKLAKKYLGQDEYPYEQPGTVWVDCRIRPDRIVTAGVE